MTGGPIRSSRSSDGRGEITLPVRLKSASLLPGQAWYHAGDLVFKLGNVETFRLEGVSRPAAFRETCLKSHLAHSTVKAARRQRA